MLPHHCTTLHCMTIQTITARLNHPRASAQYSDCYCFDNEQFGLIAEPFVPSATVAIRVALDCLRTANDGTGPSGQEVTLRFCADHPKALQHDENDLSSVLVQLTLIGPTDDGHDYEMTFILEPEDALYAYGLSHSTQRLWLCPVLLRYFSNGAPEFLFVEITPTASPSVSQGLDAHS